MTTNANHSNRLAAEKSPYLLQHAGNPVDWYPFGEEALARARAEDRPLFVSIGYSTCHWCHVMERESFENPAIAAVMNELFVNVKIDREERPDLDQVYMQAVMAMHGQGGWPLSMWLTPDLKPFYGGTYFPPESRYGRPGFVDVLRALDRVWRERRSEALDTGTRLVEWMTRSARAAVAPAGAVAPASAVVARAVRAVVDDFDGVHGGFGGAPKFPRPSNLDLLVFHETRTPTAGARIALERTLEMMARGGIYDHVGGGFARYSTDAAWLVPHFEKMLYDNASLMESYLDGFLLTGRADFLAVAQDIATWVAREMISPEGGFFSAQDADSEGHEGKFYVFTAAEVTAALGADAQQFSRIFGVTAGGNFEGSNVLSRPHTDDEDADMLGMTPEAVRAFIARCRPRLYAWREARVRPGLDDKVLASWNGLMIHALARLGAAVNDDAARTAAMRAAEFAWSTLWDAPTRTLRRRWRLGDTRFDGSLDDYACLAWGLLGVFEATGEPRMLDRCLQLVARAVELFSDDAGGGYYFAATSSDLVARLKDGHDGATPSGNSVMALLHGRLAALLDDDAQRAAGVRTVAAFGADLARVPHGFALLAVASATLAEPPATVFVAADTDDARFRTLLARAHADLRPGRVIIPVLAAHAAALTALGVRVDGKTPGPSGPRAFLCEGLACRAFDPGVRGA